MRCSCGFVRCSMICLGLSFFLFPVATLATAPKHPTALDFKMPEVQNDDASFRGSALDCLAATPPLLATSGELGSSPKQPHVNSANGFMNKNNPHNILPSCPPFIRLTNEDYTKHPQNHPAQSTHWSRPPRALRNDRSGGTLMVTVE